MSALFGPVEGYDEPRSPQTRAYSKSLPSLCPLGDLNECTYSLDSSIETASVHALNVNELQDFGPSVVVLEPEVGDQFLSSEVSERILQFHKLDE